MSDERAKTITQHTAPVGTRMLYANFWTSTMPSEGVVTEWSPSGEFVKIGGSWGKPPYMIEKLPSSPTKPQGE